MSKVFNRAQSRVLARRVKEKFTPDKEDLTKVRVVSGGVAQVAGQVYNSATGGFRAGTVVEATNVGTAGNAQYVAKYASSNSLGLDGNAIRQALLGLGNSAVGGWSESDLQKKIDDAIRDAINNGTIPTSDPSTPTPTSASPVTRTIDDIIRDTKGPVVAPAGNSVTVKIPDTVQVGDFLIFIVNSRTVYDETDIPPGSPYYPNGINSQATPDGIPDGWTYFFGASTYTWFGAGSPQELRSLSAESLWKEAEESDIGADVTFDFYLTQTDIIYYLLVLNGDYIIPQEDDSDWNIGTNEAYGTEDTDPDYRTGGQMISGENNLYIDNINLAHNYPFVLAFGVTEAGITTTPQGSWRELVDFTSGNISIVVLMKKINSLSGSSTGLIRGYLSFSDAFFAAVGVELLQVDA